MANSSRNLIVLSDGTGNSASKLSKTNVWRLYQAISLTDGTQVAVFGDGVGTSSVKVLRVIGLALGIGVKRNVLNLYKFLCRNYSAGDRIWAFGFSRGAFTIRVLAGLIHSEGLVSFASEAELNRNALAAYRAYRRCRFATAIPWVVLGRLLRDHLISLWNALTGARSYQDIKKETAALNRDSIPIHFIGVWDTVVAYGLPVDELTLAVDKWVWPMKFRDDSLLPNVQHARHALSLDDERRTFHPIPWNEGAERRRVTARQGSESRLQQVWFTGMHADVGGGYPDDGLSFVPLCWMIGEAAAKGLRFEPSVVTAYHALASPTGRMYDSRSGSGVLWRYQPRDAQLLLGEGIVPVVHGSVITRMACGNDGYAPISLPDRIDVLAGHGAPVAFEPAAVRRAVAEAAATSAPAAPDELPAWHERRRVLEETYRLATLASQQPKRADLFKLVLDTVWWRRVVYFVSLAFALIAVAFPLVAQYLRLDYVVAGLNDTASGPIRWTLGPIKGFLPGLAEPWLAAVARYPAQAALVVVGLLASLAVSTTLQRRIADRARAAWNIRPTVGGKALDRLAPSGQRQALAKTTLVFLVFAIGTWLLSGQGWLIALFAAAALLFGIWWTIRRRHRAPSVDPSKPNALLRVARRARTSRAAVRAYRFVAQKLTPAVFLLVSGLLLAAAAHRAAFDLMSTAGYYCKATDEPAATGDRPPRDAIAAAGEATAAPKELLGLGADFPANALCHPTTRRLVAGRQYRITLEIPEGVSHEWFDRYRRTDVAGFRADGWVHIVASPLKRWWRENWFQPIARIGKLGNYEHALRPTAPLPTFRPDDACEKAEKARAEQEDALSRSSAGLLQRVRSPASEPFKTAQVACDTHRPSRLLIADITADATGELFLYVNDAVFALGEKMIPFYPNNSGTAKVSVTRILATDVIPATDVTQPAPR